VLLSGWWVAAVLLGLQVDFPPVRTPVLLDQCPPFVTSLNLISLKSCLQTQPHLGLWGQGFGV
jgi:hypothetical protein